MRPAGWQPIRTGLQQVRDILLSVMALLVSVVCAVILYLAVATGNALNQVRQPAPLPAFTFPAEPVPTKECIGEEPIPGC